MIVPVIPLRDLSPEGIGSQDHVTAKGARFAMEAAERARRVQIYRAIEQERAATRPYVRCSSDDERRERDRQRSRAYKARNREAIRQKARAAYHAKKQLDAEQRELLEVVGQKMRQLVREL